MVEFGMVLMWLEEHRMGHGYLESIARWLFVDDIYESNEKRNVNARDYKHKIINV